MMEAVQQHWNLIDHHMNGVALSAALIALFTLAEIRWPAASNGGLRERIVNILIGSIVSVFAFVCTALILWFAMLVWRDGLIGLIVPGWRVEGVVRLVISVIAYGVV